MRVGFEGSQEPVLKEFGDLYANFLFSGSGGVHGGMASLSQLS